MSYASHESEPRTRIPAAMGAKAKIGISIILIVILGLAVWQLTSPRSIPSVGTEYVQPGPLSEKGSWIVTEKTSSGTVYLAISIANLTYPRAALSTTYSFLISKLNETITSRTLEPSPSASQA